MPSRRTPPTCTCGCDYEAFRTGLTFGDVRRMMWRGDSDPSTWRQKRRRSVLGFWRELKLMLWDAAHGGCDAVAA